MIVFGRKFKEFDAGYRQTSTLGDNISRTQWGIIDKTRKQDRYVYIFQVLHFTAAEIKIRKLSTCMTLMRHT